MSLLKEDNKDEFSRFNANTQESNQEIKEQKSEHAKSLENVSNIQGQTLEVEEDMPLTDSDRNISECDLEEFIATDQHVITKEITLPVNQSNTNTTKSNESDNNEEEYINENEVEYIEYEDLYDDNEKMELNSDNQNVDSIDDRLNFSSIEVKTFKCNVCVSVFRTKACLKQHMQSHSGEKKFECKICESKFSRKSYLDIHIRIHNNEKVYLER